MSSNTDPIPKELLRSILESLLPKEFGSVPSRMVDRIIDGNVEFRDHGKGLRSDIGDPVTRLSELATIAGFLWLLAPAIWNAARRLPKKSQPEQDSMQNIDEIIKLMKALPDNKIRALLDFIKQNDNI